jgi:hypothetical protein
MRHGPVPVGQTIVVVGGVRELVCQVTLIPSRGPTHLNVLSWTMSHLVSHNSQSRPQRWSSRVYGD